MITVKQAAEKWGVTPRRVQGLCKEDKIPGAFQWERTWMIPASAEYPKGGAIPVPAPKGEPIPRRCASLLMTDLYHTPGTADSVIASLLDNPEATAIFKAELAYNRLEFDRVNECVKVLLHHHSEYHTTIAAGVQLSLCGLYEGDMKLLMEARQLIFDTPCETDRDRDLVDLWLCVVDNMLGEANLPEWFRLGRFDLIPADSYPSVKFQYAKFQWLHIRKMIFGSDPKKKAEGKVLLAALPNMLEPMISQAVFDRTLLAEIALRMIITIVYHDLGKDDEAIYHLDKAISLAIPDRLYAMLVEYREMLDTLLDDRLAVYSPEALKTVKQYWKKMKISHMNLHKDLDRLKRYNLSVREREAAKLAAFGMSNEQIAKRMHISENSIRSLLSMAMNKTGAENRKALGQYL